MIIARRKVHFFSVIILGIILPITFIFGVLFQPEYPIVDSASGSLFTQAGMVITEGSAPSNEIVLDSDDIRLQVRVVGASRREVEVEITPLTPLLFPDPLLYWHGGSDTPESLEPDSRLLGVIGGRSTRGFAIPSRSNQEGHLILYSQGYSEIITSFPFDLSTLNPT